MVRSKKVDGIFCKFLPNPVQPLSLTSTGGWIHWTHWTHWTYWTHWWMLSERVGLLVSSKYNHLAKCYHGNDEFMIHYTCSFWQGFVFWQSVLLVFKLSPLFETSSDLNLLFLMCFDNLWAAVSCLCWDGGGVGVTAGSFFLPNQCKVLCGIGYYCVVLPGIGCYWMVLCGILSVSSYPINFRLQPLPPSHC